MVILRLRGYDQINSTFITLIERYQDQLAAVDGKLMLAGVSEHVKEQLDRTETTQEILGEENIFEDTEYLGQSVHDALYAANRWLAETQAEAAPTPNATS